MDLIRELKDVRFDLNLRGYDCDSVDAFLARVRAEVADVLASKESSDRRVDALEEQLTSGGESDTEGTLRRTLVLAQRLADETVADARKSAAEMVDSATNEANTARSSAEAEAEQVLRTATDEATALREAARSELEQAHLAASTSADESAAEAARVRAVATDEAEKLLSAAERAGTDRVQEIESAAKAEAAGMREPIRAEVDELERTRADMLSDIEKLEQHLVSQRARVRTAIETLRTGMTGSIDDLERLAEDDELFSPAARPALSGASAEAVESAPDIAIADSVASAVSDPPTVDQVQSLAAADSGIEPSSSASDTSASPAHAVDSPSDGPAHAGEDMTQLDAEVAEIIRQPDEAELAESPEVDLGPPTERMPAVDVDAEPVDDELLDLDRSGTSALFGAAAVGTAGVAASVASDGADSDAVDAEIVVDEPGQVVNGEVDEFQTVESIDASSGAASPDFVSAFTEAIDGLPVQTD